MKKFIWLNLLLYLYNLCPGFSQDHEKENRLYISIGMLSPQLKVIHGKYDAENNGDDFPNLNLSYEVRDPSSPIGYGGNLGFDLNCSSLGYYDVNYIYNGYSMDSYSLDQELFHFLLGGAMYFYPDQWISLNKLGLYARASVGLELLFVNNAIWIDGDYSDSPNRNEFIPYISVYGGARYPLAKWLELQAEFGYRELAAIRFGFTIKY